MQKVSKNQPVPRLSVLAVAACFGGAAWANPTNPTVVHGTATFQQAGSILNVTNSHNAIINWGSFSINAGELTRFIQPSALSAVLNRVTGQDPSAILGALESNGRVFLINPNGIVFGAGAQINVAGLVASTLNLSNDDFLNNRMRFTDGALGGSVVNQGSLTGGSVYLVGKAVRNEGAITTTPGGEVVLAAGNSVELVNPGTPNLRVEIVAPDNEARNLGTITAEAGRIGIYAGLIHNAGMLNASSAVAEGGRILLKAAKSATLESGSRIDAGGSAGGRIAVESDGVTLVSGAVSATGQAGAGGDVQLLGERVALVAGAAVDASGAGRGGRILVGGDYQGTNPDVRNAARSHVAAGATLRADATADGDGGKVVVWADGDTRYAGSISARGAGGGEGGLVEVSGKQWLDFRGRIDVAADSGRGGRVLLDPQDILLNTSIQPSPPNNPNGTPDVAFADPPDPGTYTVEIADVTGYSELYLQASRDITVANAVTMGAGNSIRLEANNNINVNTGATITVSGPGSITLVADADNSGSGTVSLAAGLVARQGGISISGATVTSTAAGTITTTGASNLDAGNVTINASGTVNLLGAITATGGTATAGNAGRNGGNVTITGAGVTTAAITANASAGNGAGLSQPGGAGGSITIHSTGGVNTGALGASGGNASTTDGNGGNGGTITIVNSVAGNVTTGTLTARSGAATGAGSGGAAGGITVSNNAGSISTAALSTAGNSKGAGGDIVLDAAGDVQVTGTISTSGGGGLGVTPGASAGNLTVTGVNRTITGAITASGGAALGADQDGGAAGTVSITGSGTLSTAAITASTGNATGTGAGGATGGITLSGSTVTAGALTTSGGANGDAGAISVTATSGLLNLTGNLAASGGTAIAGNAGRNGGAVSLAGAGGVTTLALSAAGTAGNGVNRAGGHGGSVSVVSSGGNVSVGAIVASGAAAGTGSADGGNAGTVLLDAGGASPTITLSSITATGGNAAGSGTAGSGGSVTVADNALLSANSTISAGGGAGGSGGNVTFSGTLDSSGTARTLAVNTTGTTTFAGAVGGVSALASVATNAGGNTVIGGGSVTTTGNQSWGDAVTLSADTVLTGATPAFSSTVDGGGFNLKLDYSGTTVINGANFSNIRDLETGNGGITQIAGTVTTSGTQTYNDAVLLTASTTLNATSVAFAGTVNSSGAARALTVNAPGVTSFGGAVGNSLALASLTTDAGGGTALAGNVTTANGAVHFGDAVTLAGDSIISSGSGAVTFAGTVDGGHALTVNSTGLTTFGAAVGATTALTSLATNAGGSTRIAAGVATTGNQTYGDAVLLTGNSVLSGTTPAFASTVNGGGFDLTLDFSGTVVINGANFSNIRDLATGNGGGTQLAGVIVTTGSQTYGNAVTTTGAVTLTAGGSINALAPMTATAGTLTLNAGGSIGISVPGSDFGTVQANATGDVVLGDSNNLTLGAMTAGGSLRIAANGDLLLNGTISAGAAGDAAVLAAGGDFINTAGPAALSTPAGRWLVYTANPDTAVFGGLASGNAALWSKTYAGNPPATVAAGGNRYLFAAGRTLTISAGNVSKVYGDDLTGLLTQFSVTGLNANTYGGAVAADSQAEAIVGLPQLVSAGAAAAAGVTGSPYAIHAGMGTLASPLGYSFSFSPVPGQLTVSPAPLTVVANDVARNLGEPNPPFTASYSGLRAGDTPAVLGGTAAFATDALQSSPPGHYAINVSGLSSPNYTITFLPGSLTVVNRGVNIEPQDNAQGLLLAAPADVLPPASPQGGGPLSVTCSGSGPFAGLRCSSVNRN
jgi:filamentous hemagglutinin family protein